MSQFKRKCAALHCEPFDGSHTAEALSTTFSSMLANWDLEGRNHCVVHDKRRNIVKAFDLQHNTHISYLTHSLQLVARGGVLKQKYVEIVLEVCRKIVGHLKHSSSATSVFCSAQESLQQTFRMYQLVGTVFITWYNAFLGDVLL
jgi:hypothetical protein